MSEYRYGIFKYILTGISLSEWRKS